LTTRMYRPRDDSIKDKMEITQGHAAQITKELLLPQIVERNHSANAVIPVPFFFFQRLPHGRRCSCWGVNDSPIGDCTVCFGQGIVGGFEKMGCATTVMDVTHPKVRTLNLLPDFAAQSSPPRFKLINTAVYGILETEIAIPQPNEGLDLLWVRMFEASGNSVELYCKTPSESSYVSFSRDAIIARITSPLLHIKAILRRVNPEVALPILEQIRLRVRLIPEDQLAIMVDIPREEESYTLEDYGLIDSFTTINFWTDNRIKRLTTEDFFQSMKSRRRFKPISIIPNDPAGIILGWDAQCRYVQSWEQYSKVP